MKVQFKPLNQQVMVITGASSGIGLATARRAARFGAKIVAAARTQESLDKLVDEIRMSGGEAIRVLADVANEDQVREIAHAAQQRFGGFDTWVNDAGVGMFGRLEECSREDMRRLWETNFWGVVNGSLVAVEHLKQRGGTLINIGSIVSDRAIPVQGIYSASKHAVKGFTDALRMEVEHDGYPVSVSLIKPSAIDTPFRQHARNYTGKEPQFPPPVYAPDLVAQAVLHCATRQVRDLTVGGGGRAMAAMGNQAPRFSDKVMESMLVEGQMSQYPAEGFQREGLYAGAAYFQERGGHRGMVREHSLYTSAALHPVITGAAMIGAAGLALAALIHHKHEA